MEDHEVQRQAKISRRNFALAGMSGLAAFARPNLLGGKPDSAAAQACGALDVELTEGPYYLDRGIYRKTISERRPGLPLQVRLTVLDPSSCQPIPNAAVEIWHCDAAGVYSGYTKMNPNGPGPRPPGAGFGGPSPFPPPGGFGGPPSGPPPPGFHRQQATDNLTFCRGLQLADANGSVEFETVYPGWYAGRDTHIHLKVHTDGGVVQAKYQGGHVVHTGQLFFPDALSDEVADLEPYRARKTTERIKLADDMVFADAHGAAIMLTFSQMKSSSLEAGLLATATLHVDPKASVRQFGPRP